MKKFNSVKVEGHKGTWTEIHAANFAFRNPVGGHPSLERLYLLEHDQFGEEVAAVVVDQDGKLIADGIMNGFDDFQYLIDEEINIDKWVS